MPTVYKVKQGDCVSSIAFDHGHFWETVWYAPENSDLRRERRDPNVLRSGDKITIPDLRTRQESAATDAKHTFRLLGVPAKLRIRVLDDEVDEDAEEPDCPEPRNDGLNSESETAAAGEPARQVPCANVPYSMTIDGLFCEDGTTDSDGYIDIPLKPNSKEAVIRLNPGKQTETELTVKLGHLDPIDSVTGVKQRLRNLSFDCGDDSDEENADLSSAIEAFQQQQGMEVTGELSDELRARVQEAHGS